MAQSIVRDAVLDHVGPWTEQDFLELPLDRRVELLDGSLLVSPAARGRRQWLSFQICAALHAASPRGLRPIEAVNVRVAPGRILIPDVVVLATREPDTMTYDAADARLVVEVTSPGGEAVDRLVKPQLYAAARIPRLLRVDLEGEQIDGVLCALHGGRYVEICSGERVALDEPFAVDLDLAALAAD